MNKASVSKWARPAVILVATDLSDLDRIMPFAIDQAIWVKPSGRAAGGYNTQPRTVYQMLAHAPCPLVITLARGLTR